MIQIECPFCGKRDQSEFSYGREGQITFPALNADENSWYDAVFLQGCAHASLCKFPSDDLAFASAFGN